MATFIGPKSKRFLVWFYKHLGNEGFNTIFYDKQTKKAKFYKRLVKKGLLKMCKPEYNNWDCYKLTKKGKRIAKKCSLFKATA